MNIEIEPDEIDENLNLKSSIITNFNNKLEDLKNKFEKKIESNKSFRELTIKSNNKSSKIKKFFNKE